MNKSNSFHWLVQPIFTYQESNTSIILSVLLETGISQEEGNNPNHFPLRISIALRDIRINSVRIKVEMEYTHINELVTRLIAAFKDFNNACHNGTHIVINKFRYKAYKNLIIDFLNDRNNKGICKIKLIDPANPSIETYVPGYIMKQITVLLQSCVQNYPIIASNMMSVSRQDWHFQLLTNKLDNDLPQITNVIKAALNTETVQSLGIDKSYLEEEPEETNDNVKDNNIKNNTPNNTPVDIDPIPDSSSTPNATQTQFDSIFNGPDSFDGIDLNIPEAVYDGPPKELNNSVHDGPSKEINKIENPFIAHFLNNDISQLIEYTTSVYSTSEETDIESFTPLHSLLKLSTVNLELVNSLLEGSLFTQYLMQVYIKNTIRAFLEKNKSPKGILPPTFIFKTAIATDTPVLYDVCRGMLICLTSFSILIKRLDQLILGNHINHSLCDLHVTFFIYKTLVSPFIFSLDISDPTSFKSNLYSEFQSIYNRGALQGLEDKYANIVPGGKFVIPVENFQTVINSIVEIIRNANDLVTIGDYNSESTFARENNILTFGSDTISTPLDIRNKVFLSLKNK